MITLQWDNVEHTILRYTFFDPWSWADYYATNAKRDEFFASADHVIDIILDFTEGRRIPPDAITNFRKAASWDSPKRGIVVVIGVSAMLQALANVMVKVFPQTVMKTPRPAKDLDHAHLIIADIQQKRRETAASRK